MKKLFAILFLAVYTASFAGMVGAKDCKAVDVEHAATSSQPAVCNNADPHASDIDGHPLQHICKLMETHKEVLVKSRLFTSYYPPVVSAVTSFPAFSPLPKSEFSTSHPVYEHKRYIHYRALLI